MKKVLKLQLRTHVQLLQRILHHLFVMTKMKISADPIQSHLTILIFFHNCKKLHIIVIIVAQNSIERGMISTAER